jgi:hypothetical protein
MTTTPSTLRRPPGRYDEPRALPRPVLVGGAVVLLLLLLGGSYLAFDRFSGSGVRFGLLGYRVLDDHTVDVSFEVHRGSGTTVVCLVNARDRDNAEVGSAQVTLAPSSTDPVQKVQRLTTTRRAATAGVVRCAAAPAPSAP